MNAYCVTKVNSVTLHEFYINSVTLVIIIVVLVFNTLLLTVNYCGEANGFT